MDIKPGAIITILFFLIMLVVGVQVIAGVLSTNDEKYRCEDPVYPIQSADFTQCTNATYSCQDAKYPILNLTESYCQNSTGQNIPPNTGFEAYQTGATFYGLSVAEMILTRLVILACVVGFFFLIGGASLFKKN